jgi:meiotically up-regulated gene 157 (Mug157) protein
MLIRSCGYRLDGWWSIFLFVCKSGFSRPSRHACIYTYVPTNVIMLLVIILPTKVKMYLHLFTVALKSSVAD